MRFGQLLLQAIAAKGISQREFSRSVRYPVQSLNQILKGTRLPPPKLLESWATALGDAVDPVEFKITGLLEHCPQEVQELAERLNMATCHRRVRRQR